jgi:ribosome-binding ATPase YchF (GTP1/OBG family)
LEKIILAGYRALQLCYFFTCGKDEVKAWTIQVATKAPQAAGRIHTDFEKGFIMAEVMKYEDFKECGNENAVKVGQFKSHSSFLNKNFISRQKENIDNKERIIPLKMEILSTLRRIRVVV